MSEDLGFLLIMTFSYPARSFEQDMGKHRCKYINILQMYKYFIDYIVYLLIK